MSAADLERLFWEELDGPPSAARLERIEALSRERPEMRRELEELRSLAGDLDAVEEAAAPPELRIEVRRLVASRPAHGEGAAAPLVGWMRQALAGGWKPRLAYATLGALIGIFFTYLVVGGPSPMSEVDRSRLSGALNVGTVAQPEAYEVALADSLGTLRFSSDGTSLTATLLPTSNKTLELSIHSAGSLDTLRVEEIRASWHELTTGPGTVRLVADGPVSVVLGVAADGPPALSVRVSTATGETVLDRQLDLTQLAGGD